MREIRLYGSEGGGAEVGCRKFFDNLAGYRVTW